MPTEETGPDFRRVGVVGLGLMGGSLARALRTLADPPEVVGWSPDEAEASAARSAGAVTSLAASPSDAADGADLVVLATPLGPACALVDALAPALGEDSVLSDVGSLKVPVRNAARAAGVSERWVGSHPMCGSERSGFEASRADLYRDARVWLTDEGSTPGRVERLARLWRALGARPESTTPEAHDELMVLVSHLPQLTANALARTLESGGLVPEELGPGARDMTRLAGSSPAVWRDILVHGSPSLPGGLRDVASGLEILARLLEEGDMKGVEAALAATRRWMKGL